MDKLITLEEGEVLENWDYYKEFGEKFPDKVELMEMYTESINRQPTETTELIKESLELLEKDYEIWRLSQPVKFFIRNIIKED